MVHFQEVIWQICKLQEVNWQIDEYQEANWSITRGKLINL